MKNINWIECNLPWLNQKSANEKDAEPVSFSSIAKPGMLIELESGKQMLIGHINEEGGVCNDCMGINKSDVIKRYAVILKFEDP